MGHRKKGKRGGPSVWETNEESRVTLVFKTRLGMARGMRREGVERNHEVHSDSGLALPWGMTPRSPGENTAGGLKKLSRDICSCLALGIQIF